MRQTFAVPQHLSSPTAVLSHFPWCVLTYSPFETATLRFCSQKYSILIGLRPHFRNRILSSYQSCQLPSFCVCFTICIMKNLEQKAGLRASRNSALHFPTVVMLYKCQESLYFPAISSVDLHVRFVCWSSKCLIVIPQVELGPVINFGQLSRYLHSFPCLPL